MQWLQAEQLKDKREQQALTALKAGEEQVARIALHDKAASEERAAQYRELYEQTHQNVLDLEEQLESFAANIRLFMINGNIMLHGWNRSDCSRE